MSQEVETPNVHGFISAFDSHWSEYSLAHLRGVWWKQCQRLGQILEIPN